MDEVKKAEDEKIEAQKQEQLAMLLQSIQELQEQVQAATAGKSPLGLPETSHKRTCDNDSESVASLDELATMAPSQDGKQTPLLAKIPKKTLDWGSHFNVAGDRATFIPGWQPSPRGTGLYITMPKSFREKIWQNEFFSYRDLHKSLHKPKLTGVSIKSMIDKIIDQEEAQIVEKDSMRLLDLAIYQVQFFKIYSAMYPQHASSHMDHQLEIFSLIQRWQPLVQVLGYDDIVRKHYIEHVGEAWYSTDGQFMHLRQAILAPTPRYDMDKQHKKPATTNKPRQLKPFHKSKPKFSRTGNAFCYAFNGMSKNVATCSCSNCPYPHRCANCKAPHPRSECNKLK